MSKILLTGATGLIGRKLASRLFQGGHDLIVLSRDASRARAAFGFPVAAYDWDAAGNGECEVPLEAMRAADVVVHLAGEPVAGGRWTEERRRRILESRSRGTRAIVAAIRRARAEGAGPRALVSASATGFYGDRGDEVLTEASARGADGDFLSDVCEAWETEARELSREASALRVAIARIGVVLSHEGGALEKMLPAFRAGVGGRLGSGRQWMSWIHHEDVVSLLEFLALNEGAQGVFNATGPEPVTNAEFTRALAGALGVSAPFPVPGLALKAAVGEMSAVLLGGARVMPERAQGAGFQFRYPSLAAAFEELRAHGWDEGLTEYYQEQWVPRALPEVFDFFSAAENLERITPPFLGFHIVSKSTPAIEQGTLIDYKLKIHGVPVKWRTLISEWKPGESFTDEQLKGPYRVWRHRHEFRALRGGTWMTDRVRYAVPMGALGRVAAGSFVARDVAGIFAYRSQVIREVFGS